MGFKIIRKGPVFGKGAKMKYLKAACAVFLVGLVIAGCGYTTRGYVSKTGYKTIYIAPFVNKVDTTTEYSQGRRFRTYYPLLENKITNAVVDKFMLDSNLRITKKEDADLILQGELVNYNRESIRTSTDDNPEEYRITLFVNLVMTDAKKKEILWEKNDFAGDASYFTTGGFVTSESSAVEEAAKDLARRIVEVTVEVW